MTPSFENGELKVKLDETAEPGNYTLSYTVTQVIDGSLSVDTYSLEIEVSSSIAFEGVDISQFDIDN